MCWKFSGGPNEFHTSAYSATSRSVTFSPLPPIRIGRSPAGAGSERAEAIADEWQRGLEVGEARACGPEVVPVLGVIALEPARPDAEDEPAVPQLVDRPGHLGEQLGVPVRVAGDQAAEVRLAGVDRHRGEQRVRLVVGGVGIPVEREEVVPDPDAVGTHVVGRLPRGAQLVDRADLGMELDTDLETHLLLPPLTRRARQTTEPMFITNHVLAGTIAGSICRRRPAYAFVVGFATHVVMDITPHWGNAELSRDGFYVVARRDGLLGSPRCR